MDAIAMTSLGSLSPFLMMVVYWQYQNQALMVLSEIDRETLEFLLLMKVHSSGLNLGKIFWAKKLQACLA